MPDTVQEIMARVKAAKHGTVWKDDALALVTEIERLRELERHWTAAELYQRQAKEIERLTAECERREDERLQLRAAFMELEEARDRLGAEIERQAKEIERLAKDAQVIETHQARADLRDARAEIERQAKEIERLQALLEERDGGVLNG